MKETLIEDLLPPWGNPEIVGREGGKRQMGTRQLFIPAMLQYRFCSGAGADADYSSCPDKGIPPGTAEISFCRVEAVYFYHPRAMDEL